MWLSKLRAVLALVVAAGIIGTSVTGLAFHATAGEQPKPDAEPDGKGSKQANAPPDLRRLQQDVDQLRAEVDALKKQMSAAPKPATDGDREPVLTIRIYPVAEWMSEAGKDGSLVELIENVVRPGTWYKESGPGTAEYFAAGKSLVVNQTEDVHKQIEKLLAALTSANEGRNAARPSKK